MNLKNQNLYNNLKVLTKKYYTLKKENTNIDAFTQILENSMEYKKVIKTISSDKTAKELFNKKLREKDYDIHIGGPEEIIDDFLNKIEEKIRDFNKKEFDKQYELFEEFLYADDLETIHSIHLYNYDQAVERIDLSLGICIRKATNIEKEEELRESHSDLLISSYLSDFVIEIKGRIKKEISNDNKLKYSDNLEEHNKIINNFDIILNSLRVLKKSSVFLSNRNVSVINAFTSQNKVPFISVDLKPIFMGGICRIPVIEVKEFIKIYNFLKKNQLMVSQGVKNEPRLRIAATRLNDGITRNNLLDRLIDYMIGLEALFLPDGNQELKYRLVMRVAFNLENEFENRKQLYLDMKRYYNERSKGVHGENYKLTISDVDNAEEILRRSILLWKDDIDIFDSENLTYNFFK